DHENEYVRAWAIQLLAERKAVPADGVKKFAALAKSDNSALVRLHLAAAAQRMDVSERWDLLTNLAGRDADVDDQNIPLMIWYAFEPLVGEDSKRAIAIAKKAAMPNLLAFTARRIA